MYNLLTYFRSHFGPSNTGIGMHGNILKDEAPDSEITTIVSPSSTLTSNFEHFPISLSPETRTAKEDGKKLEAVAETSIYTTCSTPDRTKKKLTFMTPLTINCENISREDVSSYNTSLEQTFSSYETALPLSVCSVTLEETVGGRNKSQIQLLDSNSIIPRGKKTRRREKNREKKRTGTPDGLKPRRIQEIRSKVGVPTGLISSANMLQLRLQSGFEAKPKQYNFGQALINPNYIEQHVPKKSNVSFASPEVTQPSLSTYDTPRSTHLHRTVKKSNVSISSSSLNDRSCRRLYSPRLSVDQAKTAVGMLVARNNASMNESSITHSNNLNLGVVTDNACVSPSRPYTMLIALQHLDQSRKVKLIY